LTESKISKTPRSSNKKPQTRPAVIVSESPTPHPVPADLSLISPEQRKAIGREILLEVTSAQCDDCPMSYKDLGGISRDVVGNHFAWGSSQINTDLALAAQCEFEEDIFIEDDTFFDLHRSPMYRYLRKTFMEDAERGDSRALLNLVWRAYNAGLVSPDRLIPDSKQVRQDRRLRKHEREAAAGK
jgi:hypothetical protein